MLKLGDVWEALTGRRPPPSDSVALTRVVVDSRQCVAGSVFVALKGEHQDGHEFIGDALARGAVAVIAERRAQGQGLGGNLTLIDVAGLQPDPGPSAPSTPVVFITESSLAALQRWAGFWRRKFPRLLTVGVTGSVGKSSTKELIYSVLSQRFSTLKTEANLNNEIGVPLTLLELNEKHKRGVLEMGTYALGEIRNLCEMALPSVGVVTLVRPVHLSRFGTLERIAQAKGELVEALPPDGYAILNGDDLRVREMRSKSNARVILYGLGSSNDIRADEIEGLGLEGMEFTIRETIRGGTRAVHVRIPLLGRHSVHNALAASAVGLTQGLSWEEIIRGLQDVAAQLRLVAVAGKHNTTILDDTYNASPSSMLAAFNLLSELNGRKVVILGDMLELGEYERDGHRLVGTRAAEIADVVIAVGELGHMIGKAAQEAGHRGVHFADDNEEAARKASDLLKPGDIVLVKGSRGAHMEDIVSSLAIEESEGDGC